MQKELGVSLDRRFIFQSAEQPFKIPAQCHAFEKEWTECAHGIGATRAKEEHKIEYEDFEECCLRYKTMKHLGEIRRQRDKLVRGEVHPSTSPHGPGRTQALSRAVRRCSSCCFPLGRKSNESCFIKYIKIKN